METYLYMHDQFASRRCPELHDGAGAVGRAVITDDHRVRVRHGRRHVRRVATAVARRPRRAPARRRLWRLRWRRCWCGGGRWRLGLALTVRGGAVAGPWVWVRIRIWVYHLAWGWLWLGLGLLLGLGFGSFGFLFWRRRLGLASTVRRGAAARPPWLRAWIWARIRAYHLAWRRLGLWWFSFWWRRRRRLGDLDVLDDLSSLAAELAGELVGVEWPRHEDLVLLVHDLLDDELPALLDAAENLLDLAATAAAVQVHGDDERRHLFA